VPCASALLQTAEKERGLRMRHNTAASRIRLRRDNEYMSADNPVKAG